MFCCPNGTFGTFSFPLGILLFLFAKHMGTQRRRIRAKWKEEHDVESRLSWVWQGAGKRKTRNQFLVLIAVQAMDLSGALQYASGCSRQYSVMRSINLCCIRHFSCEQEIASIHVNTLFTKIVLHWDSMCAMDESSSVVEQVGCETYIEYRLQLTVWYRASA